MYLGWCRFGELYELTNSARQHAYAYNNGINWLSHCEPCESLDTLLPLGVDDTSIAEGGEYLGVREDPAPWYNSIYPVNPYPNTGDSEGFYGISLLEITGLQDSMRTATMTANIYGGSTGGKVYYKQRELVLKLLLVAEDDCALNWGMEWLRAILSLYDSSCGGTNFYYYACCPCLCDVFPGPDCNLNCSAECVAECIDPYVRILNGVQVVSGPTVLEHLNPLSCGAAMTVELNMVAGDPFLHTMPIQVLSAGVANGFDFTDDISVPVLRLDPFRPDLVPVSFPDSTGKELIPSNWKRTVLPLEELDPEDAGMRLYPELTMTAMEGDVTGVRLGLRSAGVDLGSWFVRRIPQGGSVSLNTMTGQAEVEYEGQTVPRYDVVIRGDGGPVSRMEPLQGWADMELVVDRADDVPVLVDVTANGFL